MNQEFKNQIAICPAKKEQEHFILINDKGQIKAEFIMFENKIKSILANFKTYAKHKDNTISFQIINSNNTYQDLFYKFIKEYQLSLQEINENYFLPIEINDFNIYTIHGFNKNHFLEILNMFLEFINNVKNTDLKTTNQKYFEIIVK